MMRQRPGIGLMLGLTLLFLMAGVLVWVLLLPHQDKEVNSKSYHGNSAKPSPVEASADPPALTQKKQAITNRVAEFAIRFYSLAPGESMSDFRLQVTPLVTKQFRQVYLAPLTDVSSAQSQTAAVDLTDIVGEFDTAQNQRVIVKNVMVTISISDKSSESETHNITLVLIKSRGEWLIDAIDG